MGSLLGDWPSFDPHNFSQLRPSDPTNPSWKCCTSHYFCQCMYCIFSIAQKITPTTYHPTHNRTDPPPNQVIGEEILPKNTGIVEVEDSFQYTMIEELHHPCTHPLYILISTEATDILLRHFYQRAEEKLRPKRAASEHLIPDHGCKQPRGSFEHTSS